MDRIFYSILSYAKRDGCILLKEYIKITRRGHPDYTGRVEAMFLEPASKKKKVCVTVFQLASDIPNIHECRVVGEENRDGVEGSQYRLHEGKREYVQLKLSERHRQWAQQKTDTKVFGV